MAAKERIFMTFRKIKMKLLSLRSAGSLIEYYCRMDGGLLTVLILINGPGADPLGNDFNAFRMMSWLREITSVFSTS